MAIMINEQRVVEDNMLIYEQRIKSAPSRLQEVTPTYVTYFHINIDETTVDEGFKDVASLIGHRSPIRFNKIENFPLYISDQIMLQLQEMEQGYDTSFEADATVPLNTIKPVHNDYFMIPTIKGSYIFRVTEIAYDNIMADNFYRISFTLEYNDDEKIEELDKQVQEEYNCVLENIGTENNCLIEKSLYKEITLIQEMYRRICDAYISMFYSERHNVFLAPIDNNRFLYDPMQGMFINKHSLFNEKKNLQAIILTDQFTDNKKDLRYNKSVYRVLELQNEKLLSNFKFNTRSGVTYHESTFYRWHDKLIDVVNRPIELELAVGTDLLSDDFVRSVKYGLPVESDYANLLKKFFRKDEINIKEIPLNLDEELIFLNNSLEVFFFTPMILYILRQVISEKINIKR